MADSLQDCRLAPSPWFNYLCRLQRWPERCELSGFRNGPSRVGPLDGFDVEPTVEDWLVWAEGNVDQVIWDFINQNRDHLEHTGDIEPSKVYPSRRSWARLNAVLTSANMLDSNEAFDAGVVFTLTNGFVGTEAAIALVDFVKSYDRQVSIEDILDAGAFEKLADYGITEYTALVIR